MKIQICVPDNKTPVMVRSVYAGDWDAYENENRGQGRSDERLAAIAQAAGLKCVREIDFSAGIFGAIWQGSEAQCKTARDALPGWAVATKPLPAWSLVTDQN